VVDEPEHVVVHIDVAGLQALELDNLRVLHRLLLLRVKLEYDPCG
jgi:hypothetical protein